MYKLEPTTQFKKDFKSIPEDKHAILNFLIKRNK